MLRVYFNRAYTLIFRADHFARRLFTWAWMRERRQLNIFIGVYHACIFGSPFRILGHDVQFCFLAACLHLLNAIVDLIDVFLSNDCRSLYLKFSIFQDLFKVYFFEPLACRLIWVYWERNLLLKTRVHTSVLYADALLRILLAEHLCVNCFTWYSKAHLSALFCGVVLNASSVVALYLFHKGLQSDFFIKVVLSGLSWIV